MLYDPAACTDDDTARVMSPILFPATTAASPAHRADSQAAASAKSSGSTSPTGTVIAASPCQPSTIAPQSIDTRSPARRVRGPGMPCTTSSFTDAQIDAGKPW